MIHIPHSLSRHVLGVGLQGCDSPWPSLTCRPTHCQWLLQEASNMIFRSISTRILTALCSKCLKGTTFVGYSHGNGKGKGGPLSTTVDIPSIIEDLVGAQLPWRHRLLPLFQCQCTSMTEPSGGYVIRSSRCPYFSHISSKSPESLQSPKSLDEREEDKIWIAHSCGERGADSALFPLNPILNEST